MFHHARYRIATLSLLTLAAASSPALARPGGSLSFKKGFFVNTANVTGATGKTTWVMQDSFNGGPWGNTLYEGTVDAAGNGSASRVNSGGAPYSGSQVRARFDNGSTSAPVVAIMGNVDIQDASIACAAGSSQTFGFPLTIAENFQSNLEFGTLSLVPGSTFTIGLPQGFSWGSLPSPVATDVSDLTVGPGAVNGRDLSISILTNNGNNPFAGFHLNNSLVSFSGSSPDGANPFFTLSGSALFNGSPVSFSVQWQPVTITPAPASMALLGLGALVAARRRRA